MEIRPCIIGPKLMINPHIVLNLFEGAKFPAPGISLTSQEVFLIVGESHEIAISLDLCKDLKLKGKTGQYDAIVTSSNKEGPYCIKGSFAGLVGDFYVSSIAGGYKLDGQAGKDTFSIRVNFVKDLPIITGFINTQPINLDTTELAPRIFGVRGNYRGKPIDIHVNYEEAGEIQIKGKNEGMPVDYHVKSFGDRIIMDGITRYDFSRIEYALSDENEFHITGTPYKVPVDYFLTLYENGVAIAGSTGYYKSDYAFVVGSQ
jgi:hypothetical protein